MCRDFKNDSELPKLPEMNSSMLNFSDLKKKRKFNSNAVSPIRSYRDTQPNQSSIISSSFQTTSRNKQSASSTFSQKVQFLPSSQIASRLKHFQQTKSTAFGKLKSRSSHLELISNKSSLEILDTNKFL